MARTIAADHDAKRAQILRAAAKVFAEQGFDRATMAGIARECAISKANIYHYYASKDAILGDILETYLRGLRARICNIALDGLSPPARLQRVIEEILLAYQGSDHQHRVQINDMRRLPRARQQVLRGYQRDLVAFVGGIIGDTAPGGFDRAPGKLRMVTMSVFGMLNWYYMWNANADEAARRDYARLVAGLTLGGLKAI